MSSIIAKYLEKLSEYTSADGTYAYRGQGNARWEVESAAYRRLKNSDGHPPNERRFISYHKKQILEPARMNGYGIKDGQKLWDLELLAELQHHGAATCLIDFTRDFFVALWFACQSHKDENKKEQAGKVFILNINDAQIFSSLEQGDMEHEGGIEAILNFQTRKEEEKSEETVLHVQDSFYWHWSPHGMNQRILRQNSLFVFGKQEIADDHVIGNIKIKKQDKKDILEELKALGITRESLFKDMPGFASSHGHSEPIPPKYESAEEYYQAGNEAFQRDQWEKAIGLYSEAISLYEKTTKREPNAVAYCNRGIAKIRLKDWKEAEADFNKSIKHKPDYIIAYIGRGIARGNLKNYEGTIEDAAEAIKQGYRGEIVYRIRGRAKYYLKDYAGAKADLISAIDIEPDNASAYCDLGEVYVKLDNGGKARQSFQLAKELAEQSNDNELIQKTEKCLSDLERSNDGE